MIRNQTAPVLNVKSLSDAGEFEGYASTFGGEPDSYGDVVVEGAFADSLAQHKADGTMPKMFWQHDSSQVIGRWLEASEDSNGLLVHGKLNMAVQTAREAHALLKEKDIDGLSIGYGIRKHSENDDEGIWYLEKLDLMEVSVVSIGANPLARIASVKAARSQHELLERLKAGDRLTEREFELWLKGLGLSNSQAERAARVCLKGQGEPAAAAEDDGLAFLRAMIA